MNKKEVLLIAVVFLFSIQTKAQNNIQPNNIPQANIPPKTVVVQPNVPVHFFKVTNVDLVLDSSIHVTSGAGATKNYFKAVINSTGTGTIQYQWVLINVGSNQPSVVQGTLHASGTGTDEIFTERDHVTHNAQKILTFEVISPANLKSNPITF